MSPLTRRTLIRLVKRKRSVTGSLMLNEMRFLAKKSLKSGLFDFGYARHQQKIAWICIFFRNKAVLVGITLDGGVCLGLHVGANKAPLMVLCRRLGLCYGKNRLFMQKNTIFHKNRLNKHFFP